MAALAREPRGGNQRPGCTDVLMYTAVLSLLYKCTSPDPTFRQLYLMYSDVHMYIFDVLLMYFDVVLM